ncbi:CRP-like cAMP-activated global transcriptional regulator [subsurface metagenome]
MSVDIEFLKTIPYFQGLGLAELEAIKRFVFEKSFDANEFIVEEGDPGEALYFVVSGVVKAFKTSAEGKEQILRLIRPGESFNDVPVFDGEPNVASAAAMGPVVLYGIRKSDVGIILRDHPQVAANVVKVLAGRVRHFTSLVEDLSFRNVLGRVAKLLLEYAENGTGLERPHLTQQDMAAMIGTAREMVGRSLKALEEKGAIRIDRHRIVLTDKKALRETAGELL